MFDLIVRSGVALVLAYVAYDILMYGGTYSTREEPAPSALQSTNPMSGRPTMLGGAGANTGAATGEELNSLRNTVGPDTMSAHSSAFNTTA